MTCASGFFVSFAIALLANAVSAHVRPPVFYLAVSTMYAAVFVQIFVRTSSGGKQASFVIIQLLLVTGLFRYGYYLLNPTSVVSDTYVHWLEITQILTTGHIPESAGYTFYFAGFHVLHAAAIEVAGLSYSNYALVGHFVMLIAIPATYLFARRWNEGIALTAALLISITPFFVLTVVAVPSPIGIPILILAIYSMRMFHHSRSIPWLATFWILALFVLFSHPVTALVFCVLLVIMAITESRAEKTSQPRTLSNTALTYSIGYLTYLAFIAFSTFALFVVSLLSSGYQPPLATLVSPAAINTAFIAESIFSTLAFAALYAPSLAFFSRWISRGTWIEKALVVFWLSLNLVPLLEIARGSFVLQSARVLLYLSIPLTVFAGVWLYTTLSRTEIHALKRAVAVGAVFVIIVASTTSYLTGDGNRVLSPEIPSNPSFLADGTLEVGGFMSKADPSLPTLLDYMTFSYIGPNQSGRIPFSRISGPIGILSRDVLGARGYYVFNHQYSGYLTYSSEGATILEPGLESIAGTIVSNRIYDSGFVTVMENP
jgi:hypothetical protein